MQCLQDYIGLRGCGATEPESGVYVNSLPLISSLLASKIADSEQITFLGVWNDVQARALTKFDTAVIAAFKKIKSYRIKTIAQLIDLGRWIDNVTPTAASAQYRGFTVELNFPGTTVPYYLNSSLQVIYLQEVSVWSAGVQAGATIKVFDLDSGVELDSFTTDLVAGWNTIRVAHSYDAYRIFVAINASAYASPVHWVNNFSQVSCQGCVDRIYGLGECLAAVNGAASDDLSDATAITSGTNTYGVSGVFSVQCRFDWVVCANKESFTVALQNLLGAELLTNLMYSPRVNAFTQPMAKEDAKALRDELLSEFDTQLNIAVNGIDLDQHDCCIECESLILKPYLVP